MYFFSRHPRLDCVGSGSSNLATVVNVNGKCAERVVFFFDMALHTTLWNLVRAEGTNELGIFVMQTDVQVQSI